jgi:hypothetical protein
MRLAALAVVLLGCSSNESGGAAEPEKAIRAFAAATERGDIAAMRRLIVPTGRIRAVLDCPGAESFTKDVEHVNQALAELGDRIKDLHMQVAIDTIRETERRAVTKGETFHGCTVRAPFEARTFVVRGKVSSGAVPGVQDDSDETDELVRVDGVWWMTSAGP